MKDCIFCQIVSGKSPAKKVFESANLVVFPDIDPSADIHLLIVPKKHNGGMEDLNEESGEILAEIYGVVNKLVKDNNLENDLYRVVVNGGRSQHVPHLHFHLLGGQWKKFI